MVAVLSNNNFSGQANILLTMGATYFSLFDFQEALNNFNQA
jgi:hypothetical protein